MSKWRSGKCCRGGLGGGLLLFVVGSLRSIVSSEDMGTCIMTSTGFMSALSCTLYQSIRVRALVEMT